MLYVILKSGKEIEWHIGEKINCQPLHLTTTEEVYADGDELEWIKESFDNIPFHKINRVQNWSGDMARFIASNLPQK